MTYPKSYKPLHSLPQLETVSSEIEYTFNLNPSMQYKVNRFTMQKKKLFKILDESSDIIYFELYPELSSVGRFHWHGTILIKNPFLFYRDYVMKLADHYSIKIDTIEDRKVWDKYSMKQLKMWKSNYMEKFPVTNKKVLNKKVELNFFLKEG